MSKLIVPLGLIFASIGVVLLLIVPGWQHFLAVRADNKHLDEINAEIDTLTKKRDALNQQIIGITKENFERLDQIVPSGAHGPEFLVFLEQLAQARGISVVKLDLAGVLSTKQRVVEKTIRQPSVVISTPNIQSGVSAVNISDSSRIGEQARIPTYKTISVNMEALGPYDAFKDFLRDIESSIRITDIELLDFLPNSTTPGFNFKLNLKTYYQ